MSKEEWDAAWTRLKCNETHGYHCVPDKNMTSLIEFCYIRGSKLPFEKGNCLELAADGILNHYPCENSFPCGCPDRFFFSNEIYKYPKCLQINQELGCFHADIQCFIWCTQESMNNGQEKEEEIIKRTNKMDWNTLQYAAKSGNTEILQFLDERHVLVHNVNEDLKSA
ncbi:uncharacterized protein LOC133187972 [Saccostrea echinata]|uniref:uncharacterized protein LOC133187972 n=1 Tax=Saccostrea echinata TaxID=191078 RepID=UPI002A8179BF|nr:uncharacterized protein LOC133187972 [Saccostrea echinata]